MTIRKRQGDRWLECNECGYEGNEWTDDDFRAMIDEAKDEGWHMFKRRGEFVHICPDCVEQGHSMRYGKDEER